MCVIIHKPADKAIAKEDIITAATKNAHGFGYMYFDKASGRVKTKKHLFNKPEDLLEVFDKQKHLEVVYHLRIKTHGKTDDERCHPFQILSKKKHGIDLWMMHNGTITKIKTEGDESDTQAFCLKVLRPILALKPSLIYCPAFQYMISEYIGQGSKLCFLNGNGDVIKINESAGGTHDGMWVSNTHSFVKPVVYNTQTYKGGKYNESFSAEDWYGESFSRRANTQNDNTLLGQPIAINDTVSVFSQSDDKNYFEKGKVTAINLTFVTVEFRNTAGIIVVDTFYRATGVSSASSVTGNRYYIVKMQDDFKKKSFGVKIVSGTTKRDESVEHEDKKKLEEKMNACYVSHVFSDNSKVEFNLTDTRWGGDCIESTLQEYPIDEKKHISLLDLFKKTAQERFDFFLLNPKTSFSIFEDLLEAKVLDDIQEGFLDPETLDVLDLEAEEDEDKSHCGVC
jgi:hypothetical protein